MNKVDTEYFRLINEVLTSGRWKHNRTGIDTISVFGAQAKFDIDLYAFPILTTKKVHFPAIVHELLWFIKGDTNIKYLVDNNVRIWNEWAYVKYKKWFETKGGSLTIFGTRKDGDRSAEPYTQDEFVQKIKEDAAFAKEFGELGEGTYGGMWRDFPFFTIVDETDVATMPKFSAPGTKGMYCGDEPLTFLGRIDQITKVLEKLKNNPDDRRMIVSAWHPHWVDHCALPPCHCLFHFNTEELTFEERVNLFIEKYGSDTGITIMPPSPMELEFDKLNIPKRRLNCLLYQRSCDFFLGVPFNITSYALLTAMIAHVTNMVPGTFTHTYGDAHVYTNHIEQFKIQMSREPKALPKLWINPEVKSLFDFKYDDIRLENYDPHPAIKGVVAV